MGPLGFTFTYDTYVSGHAEAVYNPVSVLGLDLWIWTSWVPTQCSRCGVTLAK